MNKHNANLSTERKSTQGKVAAIGIMAVLMASMVAVALQQIQPAFAEAKTMKDAKEDKREAKHDAKEDKREAKHDAKEDKREAKHDAKEDKREAKQNVSEQRQQATSNVNGTTTSGANSTATRSEAAEKLHRGSTFNLVGSGEASIRSGIDTAKIQDGIATFKVSAKLELSVFRATPHMVLLKVTSGSITVGNSTHEVEQGKVVIAMKADKVILTAQVSDDHGTKTLRLFGSPENPLAGKDKTVNMHAIELHGKLAQWSITMKAEITKTG